MPILLPTRLSGTLCVTSTSVLIFYLAPSMILLLLVFGASQEAATSPTTIPNLGRGFLDLNRNPMSKQHARPNSIQGHETPQHQYQQPQQQHKPMDLNNANHVNRQQQNYHPLDLTMAQDSSGKLDFNKRHPRQLDDDERKRRRSSRKPPKPHPHPTLTVDSTTHIGPGFDETTEHPVIQNKGPWSYCATLCKEGMGGLACECDIVPIG